MSQLTNITLGTAGHIDHGKTSLIKLLTGCDTDHLKAEKERGMSIELGFAPCLVSELEIGIVDVPGHENFIKTMVAGASGVDGVIFVIAADDGVMPQTREHLDILTLLGVRCGIVALTKADCVDQARLQAARLEIEEFLVGTFLEGARIAALSSVTGEGFGEFIDSLKELVAGMKPKSTERVFRMPVERTFSIKGYGTVVSGIPVSGSARVGDEVVVMPQGAAGRIRAIQVYKHQSEAVMCGQCAALNVPKWDYKAIGRGDVITVGDYFAASEWYLCRLGVLASANAQLKTGMEVKFHAGTSEVPGTIYLMEGDSVRPGGEGVVQMRLKSPVVAGPRDRFIIRTLSPVNTVGGGMIIEAMEQKLRRSQAGVVEDVKERAEAVLNDASFVEYCVKTAAGYAASEGQLSRRTKMQLGRLRGIIERLKDEGRILEFGAGVYVHRDTAADLGERLVEEVGGFHGDRPQRAGMGYAELLEKCGLGRGVFDGLISKLLSDKRLEERKGFLALPSHKEMFSAEERKILDAVDSLFRERAFSPPKVEEIAQATRAGMEEVKKALQVLREQGDIVWVEGDLLFHQEAVEEAKRRLIAYIEREGGLESVKFKYVLDTSRKFAIPLLDYFDKTGLTRREGYTRYLRSRGGLV